MSCLITSSFLPPVPSAGTAAVGAEHAFLSTCGSSLSVKAAMLAECGGRGDLLVSRDAHQSVVAGLVFAGLQPQWIWPRYDERLHLAHPPSPGQVDAAWQQQLGLSC
jgi:arginine decarboxylase